MREHKCQDNIFINDGIKIIYGPDLDTDWETWILQKIYYSTEKDVEDGEAETIGEIIDQGAFIINYCPFCGKKLEKS